MIKVLVTGVSGFTGRYLVEHLLDGYAAFDVVGTDHVKPIWDCSCAFVKADLTDGEETRRLIAEIRPDHIYHLAAVHSSGDRGSMFKVNVLGTANLLEAISEVKGLSTTRVLIPGSAAEYGAVEENENPIPETHSIHPVTIYGLSKTMQGEIGEFYRVVRGLAVIRTRTFNLIGPGQPASFFIGSLIEQVRRIEAKEQEPIFKTGNLFPVRDFLDVRDAVRAYSLLMQQGIAGEIYNVGSGSACALEDVVRQILRISKIEVPVRSVRDRKRASDAPRIVADVKKLRALTGWSPEIPLARSLCDMITMG